MKVTPRKPSFFAWSSGSHIHARTMTNHPQGRIVRCWLSGLRLAILSLAMCAEDGTFTAKQGSKGGRNFGGEKGGKGGGRQGRQHRIRCQNDRNSLRVAGSFVHGCTYPCHQNYYKRLLLLWGMRVFLEIAITGTCLSH